MYFYHFLLHLFSLFIRGIYLNYFCKYYFLAYLVLTKSVFKLHRSISIPRLFGDSLTLIFVSNKLMLSLYKINLQLISTKISTFPPSYLVTMDVSSLFKEKVYGNNNVIILCYFMYIWYGHMVDRPLYTHILILFT